ncbi:la-related protein 6A [Coffea eugenioides]|uniref:La-related protein 6A n=1 Tax=Coffea arabica TaxID=13443 RepID=A0A6P6UE20_COFAR|nr:la-related protein 6A-like [Coffea arabica]XP_027183336.1 la-related protein 6A [Coffea eugenioides]
MEAEGVPIPSMSASHPPTSDDHPDFSPAGSPDLADEQHQQLLMPSDQPAVTLSDDLRDKIIKQVEYYFSDENLPADKFLMKYVSKDKDGYVPIGVVASFKKMKKLTRDTSLIVSALRQSSLLVVSNSGKKVKRVQPLPSTEAKDPMLCTVLVENLPDDHSVENLQMVFGVAGNIKHITLRDPHAARESRKVTTAEKLLSGKLHALVEYDTVEAAEKAVAHLNNEQDWRYGLRVKLLKKKTKEVGKKVWREVDAEKNIVQASNTAVEEENNDSSDHHDDSHDEEEGDHLTKDKSGEHPRKEKNGDHLHKENNGQRNRHRGRGRRQKYHGTNGHGHGTPPSSHVEPSKPPPGPKMPDGTRGFTMGRGRPLVSNAI